MANVRGGKGSTVVAVFIALGLTLLLFARSRTERPLDGEKRSMLRSTMFLQSTSDMLSESLVNSTKVTSQDVGSLRWKQLQDYYKSRSKCKNWQLWTNSDLEALDDTIVAEAQKQEGDTSFIRQIMKAPDDVFSNLEINVNENLGYMLGQGAEYYAKEGLELPKLVFQSPSKEDVMEAPPLQVCIDPDPEATEGVMFYRFGPMTGRGGYDWHHLGGYPLPLHPNANFVTGKMLAPVRADGNLLGYPPIHVHHAHVVHRGVLHWLDSHGDTACSPEWGGEACYLRHFPEGYGLPVNRTDGLALEILLNDVREYPAPPMEFYFEIGLYWKAKVKKRAAAANLTLAKVFGNMASTHPFLTQAVSLDRSVSWAYGRWPATGRMIHSPEQNLPWLHAHRTLFDQVWIFAATPEELGLSKDLLQLPTKTPQTPYLAVQDKAWFPSEEDFESFVQNNLHRNAKLKCWMRSEEDGVSLEYVDGSPNSTTELHLEAWQQRWKKTWYDRFGQLECTEWSFNRSDAWTFVAVNKEKRKGQYEKGVSLQHIEFRLWYESFEGTDPPTHEVTGTQTSDGSGPSIVSYSMDNHWQPPQHKYTAGPKWIDFLARISMFFVAAVQELFPEADRGAGAGAGKEKPQEYLPRAWTFLSRDVYLNQKSIMLKFEFSTVAQS